MSLLSKSFPFFIPEPKTEGFLEMTASHHSSVFQTAQLLFQKSGKGNKTHTHVCTKHCLIRALKKCPSVVKPPQAEINPFMNAPQSCVTQTRRRKRSRSTALPKKQEEPLLLVKSLSHADGGPRLLLYRPPARKQRHSSDDTNGAQ